MTSFEPSSRDERLHTVIADYLDREAAGAAPARDAWLAEHAEFAEALGQFLDEHQRMARLGSPLRALAVPGSEQPTIGVAGADTAETLPALRYFGDYELLAEIARGGMGVVYRARQKSLDRPVAVKMILAGQLATSTEVERFHTEATAAGYLDHPQIVPIYEVAQQEGQHYYSMKLIDGENLAQAIAADRWPRHTVAGRRQIAQLLSQAARAVHYAHQRGILHRDLKPGNILLDRAGTPHLTDFGLAKRVGADSSLTHTGAVLGTPSYMPPEQAAGKKQLTTAADVYSLGAILYEMLSGQPPFRGATPLDVMLQVSEREPMAPRHSNPTIEADLQTICLKCLEKDPARRYASAEALADDLDRWLTGQPIEARPSTPWERAVKFAKRRPALTGLVLVSMLSIAAMLVGGLWYNAELQLTIGQVARQKHHLDLANENLVQQHKKATDLIARANSMRLVAESEISRPKDPALSLLLAIESAKLGPRQAAQNNALAKALAECREVGPLLSPNDSFDVRMVHWFTQSPRVLTVSGALVRVWDVRSGKKLVEFDGPKLRVNSFAVSPDERWIALTFQEHYEHTIRGPGGPRDLRRIVVTDQVARIYDAQEGMEIQVLRGHQDRVNSVAFSRDSKRVLTASMDRTARLWDVQTGKQLRVFEGHECGLSAAEFTADGNVLTVSSGIRAATQNPLQGLYKRFPADAVDPPLPSPYNTVAGVSSGRGYGTMVNGELLFACIWDAETGARLSEFGTIRRRDPEFPRHARLDPTGKYLVATNYEGGIIWYTNSKTESHSIKLPSDHPHPPQFTADGKHVLLWTDKAVSISELKDGKVLATLPRDGDAFLSACFSPHGNHVATTSEDSTAGVWEAVTGRLLFTLRGHDQAIGTAAFSPDGRRLLTGSNDRTARFWNVEPRLEFGRTVDPEARIETVGPQIRPWITQVSRPRATWAAALSPNGKQIAIGSFDGTLRLWDTASGKLLAMHTPYATIKIPQVRQQIAHEIFSVAYSQDGRRVLTVSGDTIATLKAAKGADEALPFQSVRIYDTVTGEESCVLQGLREGIASAEFSPDGTRVLTVTDNRNIRTIQVNQAGTVIGASTGPGETERVARIFDARTGEPLHVLRGNWHELYSATWDPGHDRICTLHDGWVIRIWDATTGKETHQFVDPLGNVNAAAFSPDGQRLLTWSDTRTRQNRGKGPQRMPARVWDLDAGKPLFELKGSNGSANFAAYSPDGKWIATTGFEANSFTSGSSLGQRSRIRDTYYADRTARIWNAETGKLHLVLHGHERSIEHAEFSRDSRWLVTTSEDRTARVWDLATGKEFITLRGHVDAVKTAMITPDAKQVLTVSWDGTARLWPVDPLPLALERRPRPLTAEERERYELSGEP
jgi:WD40 repeat protein